MFWQILALTTSLGICTSIRHNSAESVKFFVYNETVRSAVEEFTDSSCNPSDKVAIIIHGFRESCDNAEWVPDLVGNLLEHRGGCILCMDYRSYSTNRTYSMLLQRFVAISDVLVGKLKTLETLGFDPAKIFVFGFSFGGRVALKAGELFGERKIGEIDTCDMAGPGFDFSILRTRDPKVAAKNVQCIHTSVVEGTTIYDCSQDWLLGNCGRRQPAAERYPNGSHSLCPKFYNAAFKYPFYAEPKPRRCLNRGFSRDVPKGFRMGYLQGDKGNYQGNLYVPTLKDYPYTNS